MSSAIFTSAIEDVIAGHINFDVDTFKLLLTLNYLPDLAVHSRRSQISGEVAGSGYVLGGNVITVSVFRDTSVDEIRVSFGDTSWLTSSLDATGAVIYKSRGGAASADELVAYLDFGSHKISTAGLFSLTFNKPLTFRV